MYIKYKNEGVIYVRRTYNSQYLCNEDGTFVGLNLGADYCAEHEWGIKELEATFGINRNLVGIKGRMIQKLPDVMETLEFQYRGVKYIGLLCHSQRYYFTKMDKKLLKSYLPTPFEHTKDCDFDALWDSYGFSVVLPISEREKFNAIMKAIENKNLAIFVQGSKNPFGRGGLVLLIVDRLPKKYTDDMENADKDNIALLKEVQKTKIEEKLKKANLRYYALSPRWTKDLNMEGLQTRYKVVFFLNPHEQSKYNSGWVTVEDLLDWIKGKGKIVR